MILMRLLIPVMIVVVALIGVPLGLWKIDTIGLGFLAIGAYFVFGHGYWRIVGAGMLLIGALLSIDLISIQMPRL